MPPIAKSRGSYGSTNARSASASARTSEDRYSIGELSREFDVTTRTIRFYESQGLLSPERRGQARVYANRDRVRLGLILRGKRLGITLKDIAELLDLFEAPAGGHAQLRHCVQRIRERRRILTTQRQDIDMVLVEMDRLEARCLSLLEHTERRHHENDTPAMRRPEQTGVSGVRSHSDEFDEFDR